MGRNNVLQLQERWLKKPKILILDDSSSALDYATDAKLRSDIKTLKDITLFVVFSENSVNYGCRPDSGS